mmetsp:Transcript_28207/g.54411  ORF Transcript_28207/g.54411 Transcript_28207/m.54411 type:complete len:245 (-) Transcript_28207:138-872(-)
MSASSIQNASQVLPPRWISKEAATKFMPWQYPTSGTAAQAARRTLNNSALPALPESPRNLGCSGNVRVTSRSISGTLPLGSTRDASTSKPLALSSGVSSDSSMANFAQQLRSSCGISARKRQRLRRSRGATPPLRTLRFSHLSSCESRHQRRHAVRQAKTSGIAAQTHRQWRRSSCGIATAACMAIAPFSSRSNGGTTVFATAVSCFVCSSTTALCNILVGEASLRAASSAPRVKKLSRLIIIV